MQAADDLQSSIMWCFASGAGGVSETSVPGLYIGRNLLTPILEAELIKAIDEDSAQWTERRTRTTKNYGPYYVYAEKNTPEGRFRVTDGEVLYTPLPSFLDKIIMPLLRDNVPMLDSFEPNQVHVALYRKDKCDRIRLHNDNKMGLLGPYIVGICLGASCNMTFVRPSDGKKRVLRLPRRCVYVMSGESHTVWRHGILDGHTAANRISITLRDVKKLGVKQGVQITKSSHMPSSASIARQAERDSRGIHEKLQPLQIKLSDHVPTHF